MTAMSFCWSRETYILTAGGEGTEVGISEYEPVPGSSGNFFWMPEATRGN